jgi:hypothetical protein
MVLPRKHRRRTPPRWSEGVDDLLDYQREPAKRRVHRAPKMPGAEPIVVTDDWPAFVPISDTELRVLEAHFAKELDTLFGPLP